MSKELEALEKVRYNSSLEVVKCFDILQQALQRLEAIDNSSPSEALECLEGIEYVADVLKVNHKIGSRDIANQEIKEMTERLYYRIPTIKQALLKAQEQEQYYFDLIQLLKENNMDYYTLKEMFKQQEPKHYLKWEDLEFKEEEQTMKVILNGSVHYLSYYRNMFGGNLCMIDNTGLTIWKENKNFFNDLHLERVEE